MADTYV